jgi:hypothetical protein
MSATGILHGDFAQLRTNPTKFPFTDQPFSILTEAILDFRLLSHCPVSDGPQRYRTMGRFGCAFKYKKNIWMVRAKDWK